MMDRRTLIVAALAAAAGSRALHAEQPAMSRITAYAFSFPALSGGDIRLADYAGHPLMIVNTASLCGFTPQYAGLQQLWNEFRERGFVIIGVPSNDFGGQEPGGPAEIAETAQHQYGVTFPIAAKAIVRGASAHPFYRWAAEARPKDVPRWNFHKYLIGSDGQLAGTWPSQVGPLDPKIIGEIGAMLPKP